MSNAGKKDIATVETEDSDGLPTGWTVGRDFDGKPFFIDHVNKITTWTDPRERQSRPPPCTESGGSELPAGWERAYDPEVGNYYVDHNSKTSQLDDPRANLRMSQEEMLKDYLAKAQSDLEAKREIFDVKQQRLQLAQDDFFHLNNTLYKFGSNQSLASNVSAGGTRYDLDLLRADISLAKSRVARLKRELNQIQAEVQRKERGFQSLAQVKKDAEGKSQQNQGIYNNEEAQAVLAELQKIQYSLSCGEREKEDLIRSLAQLKNDILNSRDSATSPDTSYLHFPQERLCAASQTDVVGELGSNVNLRIGDLARRRLEYDETRKQISELQHRLAQVQSQMPPAHLEADFDKVALIQEKENLLREMCGLDPNGRSSEEISCIQEDIGKLKMELRAATDSSSKALATRFHLREERDNLVAKLRDVMGRQASLESELKSVSSSTLSISSASSRGSLSGSTASTTSLGSATSLDFGRSCSHPTVNMQDLRRRVERLLSQSSSLQSFDEIHEDHHCVGAIGPSSLARFTVHSILNPSVEALRAMCGSSSSTADPGCRTALPVVSALRSASLAVSSLPPPEMPARFQQIQVRCCCRPSPAVLCSRNPVALPGCHQCDHPLQHSSRHAMDHSGLTTPESRCSSTCYQYAPAWSGLPGLQSPLPSQNQHLHTHCCPDRGSLSTANGPSPRAELLLAQKKYGASEARLGQVDGLRRDRSDTTVSDRYQNQSRESVTGDSGVFDEFGGSADRISDRHRICQVLIRLWYNKRDAALNITVEKVQNVLGLYPPASSQIGIRVYLIPPDGLGRDISATKQYHIAANLSFNESFQFPIQPSQLNLKTLQLTVWAFGNSGDEECLGNSLISLAEYSETTSFTKWFNIVSSRPAPPKDFQLLVSKYRDALPAPYVQPVVNHDNDGDLDGSKSDSDCNSVVIREESSDESTLGCTSQASTLTRGQRPPGEYDIFDEEDEPSSESDGEVEQPHGTNQHPVISAASLSSSDLSLLENPSSSLAAESGYGHSGDALGELCDKETNTDGLLSAPFSALVLSSGVNKSGSAALRRSHTVNLKADRSSLSGLQNCRLSRSDSDSCVPAQRTAQEKELFSRTAFERRSLRWKRPTKVRRSFRSLHHPVNLTSALDLELNLKASQVKLENLNEEVTRLRTLAQKLVDVKNSASSQLPDWFADLEKDLERVSSAPENQDIPATPRSAKVNRMLRKTLKEIRKFQKAQTGSADTTHFEKAMASFLSAAPRVPLSDAFVVIPEDSVPEPVACLEPLGAPSVGFIDENHADSSVLPLPPAAPEPPVGVPAGLPHKSELPTRTTPKLLVFEPQKFFSKDRPGVEV